MRIDCPFCGAREITEFSYLGDAGVTRPEPEAGGEAFHDYAYLRTNPAGEHREYWYHAAGCHSWLVVERNTVTHQIGRVSLVERAGA
jgi:methylglutamate dehydrogenase subunit B